ncbi:MFS transporter [Verminephrobacter eiseniae]|uniref:MFS transporter n=1 Tax=Verminephrobacter eiseniae TaxID=364317 RepID=UPI0022373084|nr:MFS transporter [Verminephrobacter eiseniae]MCW5235658.1 MFS transporter [Verminephrobacter eiseniae]
MAETRVNTVPGKSIVGIPLLLLCAANFIDGMDVSTIGVTLPAIQKGLNISPTLSQWAVSAYVLGFGGFLLLGGRVADIFGHRRVFISALLVFTLASIAGGFVTDGPTLIATRLIKGIAAAFTTPAAVALLLSSYSDSVDRAKALGIFASTSATGFVLGMLLGGAITTLNWRLTMAMGAPVTLLVLLMTPFFFPVDKLRTGQNERFDWIGASTITAGLVSFVFGVTNAADHGWSDSMAWGPIVASLVLMIVFFVVEKKHEAPMVPLSIFRRAKLSNALMTVAIFQGAYIGFQFVATLYYQQSVGWSAFSTGFAFVLIGMFVMFLSPRFSAMAQKRGATGLIALGMALQVVAYTFWTLANGHLSPVVLAFLVQIPLGLGYAMVFPSVQIAALGDIEEDKAGLATGLFFSAFQIGGGVILGLTSSIFGTSSHHGWNPYLWGSAFSAVLALLTILVAASGPRRKSAQA